jgi:N-acylneuraminate cytidylyltransferase
LEIDDIHELEVARALAPLLDQSPNGLRRPAVIGLDFDGVLTDDRVSVDQDGTESVRCHRGDGHAIARLRQHVDVVVFSTEANPVVSARCRKLGIEAVQGLGFGKAKAVRTWARDRGVPLDDVLFVGNDVNDLETFGTVGIAVAVADAVPSVRRAADVVLTTRGGSGAIRELADLLLPLFNATQEGDTTS